ncbi:MAG: RluA family pseudouridine synthase [Bacillaceae bacterium]|nr:RluA family pseudouridine synthase [Bacillaceae bacterium]
MKPSFHKHGQWLEYEISESEHGQKVQSVLKEKMQISGRMIQRLTRRKGIQLNRRKTHLNAPVKTGDRLRAAVFPKEEYGVEPEPIPLDILWEDDFTLVLNKPAGIAVHPTRPEQTGTLAAGVANHFQSIGLRSRVRFVHRLDLNTSGTILVAKDAFSHGVLDRELRENRIKRLYTAVVHGKLEPTTGTIDRPIARDPDHPSRRTVSVSGEPAVTHYQVLEQKDPWSLVHLKLDTGRTHQIRVHMSHIGHPLLGDPLYGGKKEGIDRQALHAHRLAYRHPLTGEQIIVEAPYPPDFKPFLPDTARHQPSEPQ